MYIIILIEVTICSIHSFGFCKVFKNYSYTVHIVSHLRNIGYGIYNKKCVNYYFMKMGVLLKTLQDDTDMKSILLVELC